MAAPPPLEIEDPTGRRVTVAPASCEDRLGALADALGLDPCADLRVDGRTVSRHDSLAGAGLRQGSRLGGGPPAEHPGGAAAVSRTSASEPTRSVSAVVEAGPGAGTTVTLAPGHHVLGRAGGIAVADATVEPHHALVATGRDGAVALLQLTGRVPCRVDGTPVTGWTAVPDGAVVTVGASRLRVGATVAPTVGGAVLTPSPGDPWRRMLRRTPRAVPRWDPEPVPVPVAGSGRRGPGVTGIVAALCTALATAVLAVAMRSPLFLLMAGASLVASVAVWAIGSVGARRDGRRSRLASARDVAAFASAIERQREARWRYHLATTPGIADAVTAATSLRADVWSRRANHPDAFRWSLGWGPVDWTVAVDGDDARHGGSTPELAGIVAAAGGFADAPVGADLGPGAAVAVCGPGAAALVRAALVQLVTWLGPADLHVVVVVERPDAWDWCRWLPHAAGIGDPDVVAADDAERLAAMLAGAGDPPGRHVVVVTDRADLLAVRTGALRRFLGGPAAPAVLAVVTAAGAVPALCRSVIELGAVGSGRWWADASVDSLPVAVHPAGVTLGAATAVARTLAALSDPEDLAAGAGALAVDVRLGALHADHGAGPIDDAIAIAATWRAGGADPPPTAVVGVAADGVVAIDLVRDGPHALIAGTTGAGKSELLRTLVVGLAARCSPDHLAFVLVDYKGGATFDACADLPHTVGVVTDLDEHLAARALTSLDAELRRREHVLRSVGAVDLTAWRAHPTHDALPRLVVVVDEFATLAAELPDFVPALVGIAQRGRSLGVHLVLATQRPAGVVSDDIRANTNLRLALRLHDVVDARDIVGDDAPVGFPRRAPGRAVLRLGAAEHVVFQAAHGGAPVRHGDPAALHVHCGSGAVPAMSRDGDSELAVLVRSIRQAASLCDIGAPHRPWLPALPTIVDARELPAEAVGLVDDPARQRRLPLTWSPAAGNLAIIGAAGSGATTALRAVVVASCRDAAPSDLHVHVVDARGDERLDELAALDHCGGVVRPHETERLSRLFATLCAELDDRRAAGGAGGRPVVVLAIDGFPALRSQLDDPLAPGDHDALVRILTEGSGLAIVTVLTAERSGALPAGVAAACAERWLLHVDDARDASILGVAPSAVPGPVPGRLVIAASGLEAQLADVGAAVGSVRGGPGGPRPIGILAAHVDGRTLPSSARGAGGELALVVGIDFGTLQPAAIRIPDGEHAFVAGPARSGRTTALARLVAAWRQACPGGLVRVVAPRPADPWRGDLAPVALVDALDALEPAAGGALLVIDDADRVDDIDGRLGALVARRRPGLLVVAAARPDGVRPLIGHWTGVVRRSRTGMLMAACSDVDGDLLGDLLPRRRPLPARPGLAWVVDLAGRHLAQLAQLAP